MRLGLMAVLLAAAPAPGGESGIAGPRTLGPEAPTGAYASVPLAGLRAMTQDEVVRVLKTPRSYPEHSRVPVWHQRNSASRLLSFRAGRKAGEGKAANSDCEPAACEGRYSVSGNMVTIDFSPRQGVMRLSFFVGADGVAMVFDDWGPKDGRASPW
ncbi:hypothetical protein OF829_04130 [Sphingomonas sp. LB-2]|uniref:hypothetical protein n=1 Tax=Sphingomonas caeni TaxID=2984949 RepID=UPI0022303935|nr:hypothetical protein [Sphingomonas caeni]MCW3846415.1 hypothetical protein [Sphingomonas caeni]